MSRHELATWETWEMFPPDNAPVERRWPLCPECDRILRSEIHDTYRTYRCSRHGVVEPRWEREENRDD